MTRVSVCMPVYNGATWLPEQLDSILTQLGPDDELILHDDGSSDNSLQLLEQYQAADARIRVLESQAFGNVIKNVEYLLQHAKGEYLLLSDQDDVWLANKLEKMLLALQNATLVVHDCAVVDSEKNILYPSFFKLHGSKAGRLRNFIRNGYLGCCMGFRRSLLQHALPFPQNLDMHDIWLGNVAAWWGEVLFIDDQLLYYRRHGGNVSSASEGSKNGRLMQLQMRFKLFRQLLTRFFR